MQSDEKISELDSLRAENDRLRSLLTQKLVDSTMIANMGLSPGECFYNIQGGAAGLVASCFAEILHQHESANYVEISFLHDGKPVDVTVQRGDRPTPHQLRKRAEEEIQRLHKDIEGLKQAHDFTATKLNSLKQAADCWDFVKRHWSSVSFAWNRDKTNSMKWMKLAVKTDHISGSSWELEREIQIAIEHERSKLSTEDGSNQQQAPASTHTT